MPTAPAVLFLRPCGRCGVAFFFRRAKEPSRRYCDACREPAERERGRRANATYRRTPEGREQHRDEQKVHRERQLLARVGDRDPAPAEGALQLRAAAAPFAVGEERADEHPHPHDTDAHAEWLLVAWPELLTEAATLVGTLVPCPDCGQPARVVRVLSLEAWLNEVDPCCVRMSGPR